MPGIVVPDALQAELEHAGPDAAALGFEHARKLVDGARARAAGICAVAPFRQPLRVLELL